MNVKPLALHLADAPVRCPVPCLPTSALPVRCTLYTAACTAYTFCPPLAPSRLSCILHPAPSRTSCTLHPAAGLHTHNHQFTASHAPHCCPLMQIPFEQFPNLERSLRCGQLIAWLGQCLYARHPTSQVESHDSIRQQPVDPALTRLTVRLAGCLTDFRVGRGLA